MLLHFVGSVGPLRDEGGCSWGVLETVDCDN